MLLLNISYRIVVSPVDRLAISRHPRYQHVLRLIQEHSEPIFLEIGCGCKLYLPSSSTLAKETLVGSDIQKVVADGWPVKNAIACDSIQVNSS